MGSTLLTLERRAARPQPAPKRLRRRPDRNACACVGAGGARRAAPAPARAADARRVDRISPASTPARRRVASRASSTSTSTTLSGSGEKGRITDRRRQGGLRGGGGGGAALPEVPRRRFRQVRAGRDRAAIAHQAHFRPAPARLLGQRSRTSRIATKPTSPSSTRSASRSTTRPRPTRRRPIASRCCRC